MRNSSIKQSQQDNIKITVIGDPEQRFQSPKKKNQRKQPRTTAFPKSPISKILQEMEPLPELNFTKTPKPQMGDEMMFYQTPDNRSILVEGKLGDKLDFDQLGESLKKRLETVECGHSVSQYEEQDDDYNYEEIDESQQCSQDYDDVPANIVRPVVQVVQAYVNNFENPKQQKEAKPGKICCNCKKSRCLKLYCQCFRNNELCSGCNCVQCLNIDQNCPQRYNAMLTMMQANPQAFCPKIESQKHTKGCKCQKSNCLKKYCQCYQAGLGCSQLCRCQDCKNTKLPPNNPNTKSKFNTNQISIDN